MGEWGHKPSNAVASRSWKRQRNTRSPHSLQKETELCWHRGFSLVKLLWDFLTYNCKICALSATKFVVIEQQKLTHLTNTGIQTNFIFMPFSLKTRKSGTLGLKLYTLCQWISFFLMPTNFWGFLFVSVFWLCCTALQDLRFPTRINSGFCSESTEFLTARPPGTPTNLCFE